MCRPADDLKCQEFMFRYIETWSSGLILTSSYVRFLFRYLVLLILIFSLELDSCYDLRYLVLFHSVFISKVSQNNERCIN